MWPDPTRRAFLLRGLIISRYFFLPFPLYYFFPFFLFLFPEKRSRWRSSKRIRTRRMPCSTSSWVSHSCKGVSRNIFLNVSYENWTRFVTVIFLFVGASKKAFFFHDREMEIEGIEEIFQSESIERGTSKGFYQCLLFKIIGTLWSGRCPAKKKRKRGRKLAAKFADFLFLIKR